MLEMLTPQFYVAALQIIVIDILLGGDNAVVIALACRKLNAKQRNQGIFWGVFGAVGLRVILIFFALKLLALPFLKIIGGLLLLWIGVKLLLPEDDAHTSVESSDSLWGAVKTIVIADAVMSLDNVIAVAGAAHGDMLLVVFGIAISIPIIVWGSKLVMGLMDRFPMVITLGGGLLGWIAGHMMVTDIWATPFLAAYPRWLHYPASVTGALFVVIVGSLLARRKIARQAALAKEPRQED
ncbi:MAG: TerC family protein [Desulfobulbaceae bacterium]|jgi:YjbE family integral membrane protein|nr:TerC family protein [Desulfobulbaceae bacterium]